MPFGTDNDDHHICLDRFRRQRRHVFNWRCMGGSDVLPFYLFVAGLLFLHFPATQASATDAGSPTSARRGA